NIRFTTKFWAVWRVSLAVLCVFCATQSLGAILKVTSSTPVVLIQSEDNYQESALLDVGITPFGVGLEFNAEDETVLPAVRSAEGVYFANQLAKTIEQSGAWGAVRTIAKEDVVVDLIVKGIISKSDGQTLDLEVEARDSSGRVWFSENYNQVVGKYAYDRRLKRNRDPFQNTFNQISNDLLQFRQSLKTERAATLRAISNVRFAQQFAPDAFANYLEKNVNGEMELLRLPAEQDTVYLRTQKIRERDYLYIDTMQDYYDHFSQNMHEPYQSWRRASYDVVVKIDRYNSQGNQRIFAGVLAVVAGIYGRYEGNNQYTSDFGTATAAAGGYLIKSGLEKKSGKTKFIENLSEMGASLEMEIEPQIIKLDDSAVTLSGTVDSQYEQWKVLLKKIYHAERGTVDNRQTESIPGTIVQAQ
ncbi:MAG: hypothetical protein ACI92E_001073, partial [Oceanicoccus sp.]